MFCPECGTKIDEGARFCGNCGTRIEEGRQIPEMPEVQDEIMPWEQNVEAQENEKMPWEQNVEVQENEKMPWEQPEEVQENEKIFWEQPEETEIKQQEQEPVIQKEPEPPVKPEPSQPLRPSQLKKERQKAQQSGSTITIKKPDINVRGYKERTRKLTKFQIAVIVEVIILVAAIGVFSGIGSSKSSAEAIAKQYFKAYMNKDWDTYYDLMDHPEGEFLQKEQFVEMMKKSEVPDIKSFEITGVPVEALERSSGIQKLFYVNYIVKGAGTDSMQLSLVKQGEKSMLFFDTWKVSANSYIAQNFNVSVPSGASAAIDGILLSEENQTESMSAGLDSYNVTLFSGEHTLQAVMPWYELYEESFTAFSGDYFTVSGMKLTDEGATAVQAKMQEALEKIYQAAAAKEDFSKVEGLFLEEGKEYGEESYNALVNALHDSDSYTLEQVTFDDFRCEVYDGEPGLITAELSYDYDVQYIYTYTSWRNNSERKEQQNNTGSNTMSAVFGYDGETYRLLSVNIRSVL